MDGAEVALSQRHWHRHHVVKLTMEERESVGEAARLLGLSERQVRRLRGRVRREGPKGLVHGNRGRRAWNRTGEDVVEKVVRLAREKYQGFNDTHLTEKLGEVENIQLSRWTVRRLLRAAKITTPRRRRPRRHYRRRERRAQEGSLLLWDGSEHRWLGEGGPEWTLVGVMDDATGAFLGGVFAEQEDAQSYLTILRQVLVEKGIPLSIYMDRHGIFRRNDAHWTREEELAGEQRPTQVGGALKALGIEPIFALSPQAKGRVERLWGTFQDRLIGELRLAGIRAPARGSRPAGVSPAHGGVSQAEGDGEDRLYGFPGAKFSRGSLPQEGKLSKGAWFEANPPQREDPPGAALKEARVRQAATAFLNGPFKADFNRRFAKPPQEAQPAWRPLPRGLDVDRVCSLRYDAVVGNDNAVRLGSGIILDIPPGPNRRGYAKARVEARQLLDGRWRVYYQDRLLLETERPIHDRPLRTLRRKNRSPSPLAPHSHLPRKGADIFAAP